MKEKGLKNFFTTLNVPKESLITIINEKYGVQDHIPFNLHTLNTRDKTKYCSFHRDFGRIIENYIHLKKVIEKNIRGGCLKEYVLGVPQKDVIKGNERVIELITTEVPSLTKI